MTNRKHIMIKKLYLYIYSNFSLNPKNDKEDRMDGKR